MPTAVPVVGQTYSFGVQLRSQADANLFVTNPGLQAADFRITINGGAYDTLDNLPTVSPAGGDRVAIVVSAAETTAAGAGGNIHIDWKDAAGGIFYPDYAEVIVHATDLDSLATAAALATVDGKADAILLDTGGPDGVLLANGAITAAKFAAGAITAATFAADALCAVWSCASRTLTGFGSLVTDIVSLLLKQSSIAAALRKQDLTLYRGDSWSQTITGLGDLTGNTDIWVGVKADPDDEDSESIFLISRTNGLEVVNGAVAGTPANGVITVVGAPTAGVIQVDLDEVETAKLEPDKRFWDAQKLVAGTMTTPRAGRIAIIADIVRATT